MLKPNPISMKSIKLIAVLAHILIISAYGQKPSIELIFTAINNLSYIQLDSIKVINLTQGGDTLLNWPDTVLVLDYLVGINSKCDEAGDFHVFQNYPNPFVGQTYISLYIPEKDKVSLTITDGLGQKTLEDEQILEKGFHTFRYTAGGDCLHLFIAQWRGKRGCIKILLSKLSSAAHCSLEYEGFKPSTTHLKALEEYRQGFPYNLGDTLIFTGYHNISESYISDIPEVSESFTFQFAVNIPCPGMPTVIYEGQTYNTVQIFNQCWLKENLNVGIMISGSTNMTDNGIIEKYCYYNKLDSCDLYGGLYQWNEMMDYNTVQGAQGICPSGWHIPTDEEWKQLEGEADSQYCYPDQIWNGLGWRGFDAGFHLKSKTGWGSGGNGIDTCGFSALPGGYRWDFGYYFGGIGVDCFWWSSSLSNPNARGWYRLLRANDESFRGNINKYWGYSVRCLKD